MKITQKKGQTAVEYILLLAVVVAIVLIALPTQLPRVYNAANIFFDKAANSVFGDAPNCGDGFCNAASFEDPERCCDDCGGC